MEILEQPQADFFEQHQSTHALEVPISCSTCSESFSPSSTNTNLCIKCISTQTDISIGITKQAVLNFCRTCKRYLSPPWVPAELESKDLLAICLRRVRGLNKVKLLDACFIWTEPHSRRIKINLTVQKEVLNGVTVQQTFPIEFVVYHQQCEDCKKESTPDTWGALVQVRQKADHKKTFYFLEQLILKYNAHDKVLNIRELPEGIDFFFKDRSHAQKLVDFLQTMFAVRVKQSKQLISQDLVSNTCHYKYTFSVDLPRICKDDLVILPPRVAAAFGGCSCVLVCTKVTTMITFIDPITLKTIEISALEYFKYEDDMSFIPSKGFATEFFVFDLEPAEGSIHLNKVKCMRASIARVSDYQNFDVKTYLGDVLKVGSSVLGFELSSLNLSNYIDDNATLKNLPEVILVKKSYPKSLKKRIWKLKQLEKDEEEDDIKIVNFDNDYEEFLKDLETDPEMRSQVNLYRNEKAIREKETDQMVDEAEPQKSRKKKLKIKRKSTNRQPLAAAGGKNNEGNDDGDDDKDQDENRDSNAKEVKQQEDKDEDDALVRIEELLADLTLEDQIVEDNDDAIEEFIRRLENVRIEGKE